MFLNHVFINTHNLSIQILNPKMNLAIIVYFGGLDHSRSCENCSKFVVEDFVFSTIAHMHDGCGGKVEHNDSDSYLVNINTCLLIKNNLKKILRLANTTNESRQMHNFIVSIIQLVVKEPTLLCTEAESKPDEEV